MIHFWSGEETRKHAISCLEEISMAPFDLHLTGSRYFGRWNVKSDWDFFCTYTKESMTWLENTGMYDLEHNATTYGDPSLIKVLSDPKHTVQVQLVHSAKLKLQVQKVLKSSGLLPLSGKSSMKHERKVKERRIWTAAWHLTQINSGSQVAKSLKELS